MSVGLCRAVLNTALQCTASPSTTVILVFTSIGNMDISKKSASICLARTMTISGLLPKLSADLRFGILGIEEASILSPDAEHCLM